MRAGAVAIKQYAWYYAMHYRGLTGTGGCADVYDNSNDQIYAPESQTPAASHIQAVESTWPETLTRSGAFLFTGYRPGTDVACGADADGNRLYQKSARQCALGGKTGEEILHIYYDPIVITGAPTVPGAPTAVSVVGYDSSAFVNWSAPASDGGSAITGYTVTSTPDGKTCSTTGSLSCAVSGLTNGAAYTFSVTATNIVGTGAPSDPSPGVVPAVVAGGTFVPLTPARLLDTRSGNGLSGRFSAGVPRSFQVAGRGGVPANATAVTGNLTVTDQTSGWAVFLGPVANPYPTSSTINFTVGQVIANGVTVALGSDGTLSATYISTSGQTTNLVFDVTGFFTPDTSGATFVPLTPARLLDTRVANGLGGKFSAGVPRTFAVSGRGGVPANATAVTGNLTVTDASFGWAVALGPDPLPSPTTSTINFSGGQTIANGVTVALGSGGTLSATYLSTAGQTTNLVFDVTGYFVADSSGATYVPVIPGRLLDTRYGNGLVGPFSSWVPRSFAVTGRYLVPVAATAVTGNLTVTDQTSGYAVFLGPNPTSNPSTSTVNFLKGDVRANGVTIALAGDGSLSATYLSGAGRTTSLVFDVTGYFQPAGAPPT